jgi:hypothetical protein
MYRLPWRTAKPLEPLAAPGCDNVTVEWNVTIQPSDSKPYVNVSIHTAPLKLQVTV